MGVTELTVLGVFVLVVILLILVQWQARRNGDPFALRPIAAFDALRAQKGMVMESGRRLLVNLGSGPLHTSAGPTSLMGVEVLDTVADTTGRGRLSPLATVGAATLLPIANDKLRSKGEASASPPQQDMTRAHFIADESYPFAYAAGVADMIQQTNLESSIALGRFGPELALIGEAAARAGIAQVMGSDEPAAIAIALATTENNVVGEELFAAGAYLRATPSRLAGVRVQDFLRWLIVTALLLVAVLRIFGLI